VPPKPKKTYTPPKTLEAFLNAQEKKFGDRLMRHDRIIVPEYIPTGSVGLDVALGGGWRTGRIHQVVGQPGTCKTSLAIKGMAEAQKLFPTKVVAYIDVERTFEEPWAEALGLDLDRKKKFTWAKVDSSEEASDLCRDMLRSELYSMVVVDSIGGMERAQVIYDKDAEESDMGKNSQVIGRLCKQCAVIGDNTNTTTLVINQFRKGFDNGGYDKPSGPMILGYSTTDSVTMRKLGGADNTETRMIDGSEIEVSRKIIAKVDRSKIFPQGRKAEFMFNNVPTDYGPIGIDRAGEVFMIAERAGVLATTTPTSSYWVLPDGTKVNGEKAVKTRLRAEPDLLEQIRAKCVDTVAHERIVETKVQFEQVG
jgi:recombination protein RecA